MNDLTLQDILQRRPRVIALVLLEQKENEWHYKRLVGRTLTNHVITEAPLREGEVKQLREKPASFVAMFTALMSKTEEK